MWFPSEGLMCRSAEAKLIYEEDLHSCFYRCFMYPHKHEHEKCNLYQVNPTYAINQSTESSGGIDKYTLLIYV